MQTRTDCFALALDWLHPLGSWEAATRWNTMAFEWMTRGWHQWLELATVWPALENPAAAVNEVARGVEAIDVPASVIAPAPSLLATSVAAPQEGTQKARNARALADQAAPRGKEGGQPRAKARKRSDRPVARGTASRPTATRTKRKRG